MSSNSALNRRSFLGRGAALAAVPAVASLAVEGLTGRASAGTLAAVVAYASGPVIKKYLGVLAAADVYTASTTFAILESIRLDLGFASQVHP